MKSPLSLGLTLSDRYTITQLIYQEQEERGYLAENEERGGEILLLREFFTENASDFQNIRSALQMQCAPLMAIKHPNLQNIYEIFTYDDRIYVAEEYLNDNANTLFSNTLDEYSITVLLEQSLSALVAIHQVNVYHRNVSPAAIFKQVHTERFVLKDFGVFQNIRNLLGIQRSPKFIDQVKETTGITFLSDQDADLYTLGVTVVSLLTGKSLADLFDPYTRSCIWERYKVVSDRLADVLNKMLAVNPTSRFASAAAALDAIAGNNQTLITPIPQTYNEPVATYNAPQYGGQPYNSPESSNQNNWDTRVASPAPVEQPKNNKLLVGVGVGIGVMLLAIAAILTSRNSQQPQVVNTPTSQPTVVVTVTAEPTATNPPQSTFTPAPTAATNTNITAEEAKQLITSWQDAKPNIFAAPFDRQLAAQYTTGSLLEDIVKSGGSIDWLRQKNAFYKYGFRSVGAAKIISGDPFQAIVEVRLIEQFTMYANGKVDQSASDYYDKMVRFVLRKENGVWKISDRKSL